MSAKGWQFFGDYRNRIDGYGSGFTRFKYWLESTWVRSFGTKKFWQSKDNGFLTEFSEEYGLSSTSVTWIKVSIIIGILKQVWFCVTNSI